MDLIGHCSHIHTQVPANYLWYSKILQVKSRKLCWWYYNHFLRSNNGYHFKLIPISYSIVFFIEKRQNTFLVVYRANSYVRFVDNFSMQSRLVNKGSLSSSMSCTLKNSEPSGIWARLRLPSLCYVNLIASFASVVIS